MSFAEKLKALRARRNFTQQHLADAMGVSKATVSDWENGKQQPRMERLALLAEKLSVAQSQLLDDDAEPLIPEPSWGVQEPRAAYGMEPILAWEHPDDLPPGEFVMVPRLNVKLSGGPGNEQVEIDLVKESPQAFRTEWIRQQRLKPSKLAAMRANGDSMEPTIHSGDSLLVDTSQTEVIDGRVYALWYDGGERVKRLFRLPGGGLRIKSDNTAHPLIELGADYPGHVRVIGRVVHRSGIGGL